MKPLLKKTFIFALFALWLPVGVAGADHSTDAVEIVRSLYQTDRQAYLAGSLQWTDKENEIFWPLYRSYRADMEKIGDELVKLVLEYRDAYPNVPDDRAASLLKKYSDLEKKFAAKRAAYFKKASKALPPSKVLRWVQLENRMDVALRLQLAGAIPIISAGAPQ